YWRRSGRGDRYARATDRVVPTPRRAWATRLGAARRLFGAPALRLVPSGWRGPREWFGHWAGPARLARLRRAARCGDEPGAMPRDTATTSLRRDSRQRADGMREMRAWRAGGGRRDGYCLLSAANALLAASLKCSPSRTMNSAARSWRCAYA